MKHIIKTKWNGSLQFISDIDGHEVIMDATAEHGGKDTGPSPKKLMLSALAGCTGIDVVSILEKMRVPFDTLSIEVEGDVTDEHPKHYSAMHIIYHITGSNLDISKIEKAVQLSQDRYCGVSHVYKKAITVTYEIRVSE